MVTTLLLTGCHADITYRLDVHSNNTVTVAIREKLDDQFYNMAVSQSKDGDPFGAEAAKKAGWEVSKSVNDDGDHVNLLTRTVPLDSLKEALSTGPSANGVGAPIAIDPSSMTRTVGFLTDRSVLHVAIPAPMGKPETASTTRNPLGASASAMVSSIVSMHFELKTPGKVLDTNGDTTSDGAVRWNLNLQGPTDVQYTVETTDLPHAILLATILLAVIVLGIVVMRHRKPKTLTLYETPS
jgi:hypothetical protein